MTTEWGHHATAGYWFSRKLQVLGRWERFRQANLAARQDLILGLNAWPTGATEIQVNYLIDPDDAAWENHALLVNFQIGF